VNMKRLIQELKLEMEESKIHLNHNYFATDDLVPLIPSAVDPEELKKTLEKLAQSCRTMKEMLDALFDPNSIDYKTLALRLSSYEGGEIENLSPLYAETLYHMMLGGLSPAHSADSEGQMGLDLVTLKGGNAMLTEELGAKLEGRLHLNHPLVELTKDPDQSFCLCFANGKKVKADLVVLSIPCSTYEKIRIAPDVIPFERQNAIRSVRYGTNSKVLASFAEPMADRVTLLNDSCISFLDDKKNVITMYYTGKASLFSEQALQERYANDRPMLEKGFAEVSKECVVAEDKAYAVYETAVGHSWPNDPYAKGSYSYIAAGQEEILTSLSTALGEPVKSLFAPIDQRLFFAGEHASCLPDVPGTMEAACDSGECAARLILRALQLSN
jgi:monoamine oxidase